ncbi:glycosyltransferase family 4 protein [Legionella pneumophila]|uniref:glycosyltransferase family 4 protein n=1 Tax=Legionella pneumophila TaxID=446 RepID=UPI0016515236|nr:glycosyltransferase family 1 protein [Legionella pneumophila]HDO7805097.1 glycosyltransferase family 4 protein [Legionella pneumophila]HDO7833061.1 glycosyltransferase family 4 protein [Legionella pneumophila]HDO7845995.1 glycosyltransferase family 4 protein [Legionella pneumophila]HDO9789726.1 glycosyltransferase family 4 protein [Legionella pneumophila]
MKQLLIDITSLANELRRKRPPHGIPRVTLAYLSNYYPNLQVLFRIRKRVYIFQRDISKKIILLLLSWDFNRFWDIIRLIPKGVILAEKLKPNTDYVLLKTDYGGFKNSWYIDDLKKKKINLIAVVHDLIPITNPEYCSIKNSLKFSKCLNSILDNAKGIVTVSEYTRSVLNDYVSQNKKSSPPTMTALLASGLSTGFAKEERIIKEKYFLTVSTIGDRKNHLLLLHVWRKLVEKMGGKAPKLIIVGKRSTSCNYTHALLERCSLLQGFVFETKCTDQELANYLYYARALLFPTFTEGFGLPLIEALSLKVPVIASDIPVFREIAGDIPDYLDPIDGKGWMEYIENYMLENSSLRQRQLDRISNFKIPLWDEHFAKVDAFIDLVMEAR